jgi:hypothetical protein
MRRSYLTLIALTLGLLTLACSGGGSSLVGPGAVTDSGQVGTYATGTGPSVQMVQVRAIDSGQGDIEPID